MCQPLSRSRLGRVSAMAIARRALKAWGAQRGGVVSLLPYSQCRWESAPGEARGGQASSSGRGTELWAREQLYPTHVPLSALGKLAVAAGSAVGAVLNPARADLVAAVGETTGAAALAKMRARMLASEEGAAILRERPTVTSETARALAALPPSTFGGAYHAFMAKRGFSPDDRPAVRFVDDPDLAYVARRAREAHDFWHVLFGCPTTVLGELALKGVELAQTGMPVGLLAVAGAQFRLEKANRQALWGVYMPWALRTGLRCADLMSIYYERHFADDLQELRARLRIQPAPTKAEAMAMVQDGTAQGPL